MRDNQEEFGDESLESGGESELDRGQGPAKRQPPTKQDGPACQECRKKKARCTRRAPCSHCARNNLECVYDDTKSKPGMRPGAVEALNQRLTTLENMFLGQSVLWQQVWRCLDAVGASPEPSILAALGTSNDLNPGLQQHTGQLKDLLSSLASQDQRAQRQGSDDSPRSVKRPRLNGPEQRVAVTPSEPVLNGSQHLSEDSLPDDLIDSLVDIYFARIHPWIPMLHTINFRRSMKVLEVRPKLASIFWAVVSLCSRFSDDVRRGGPDDRSRLAKACRQRVILQSMETFSVENLQALIICAFDTIGSGRGPPVWSIVGSMTRTAEQLQLSIEEEDRHQANKDSKILVKRMNFLPPCRDWIETEERRRVFWNAFLMDRFCSIATGWNLSLTGADVKRRLPYEGALWEEGQALSTPTPYFGVSEKPDLQGPLPSARSETADQGSLGAFAYCIEATESLSLVTSFFLQQAVDVSSVRQLQIWLMRFKQLDLRLVQWKVFLPERWREACARNADGNMDPNLTLAHVTHNTAVVLLHQSIAYPSAEWQSIPVRLPSVPSAETCLAAAKEVAIITDNFLQFTDLLTNPQFAFCLFVCGRMLITHAAYCEIRLPEEFDTILTALREISRRWKGSYAVITSHPNEGGNLASKFASRLAKARDSVPDIVDIREAAYSDYHGTSDRESTEATQSTQQFSNNLCRQLPTRPEGSFQYSGERTQLPISQFASGERASPSDSISMAFPPLPLALQEPGTNHLSLINTINTLPNPYGPQTENGMNTLTTSHSYNEEANDFNILNSYLDYTFPPSQRVSMFSCPEDRTST